MKIIGLDFDNTLVIYDNLFYKVALEKNLIDTSVPQTKRGVREYLISNNQEGEFTILQGEVYGLHILKAECAKNLIPSLRLLFSKGYRFKIISHKTQYPYKGPKHDLRLAAMQWLAKNNFFASNFLGISSHDVFFANTKEQKAETIVSQNCFAYVDDLPEILNMLPDEIQKILYNPQNNIDRGQYIKLLDWSNVGNLL